MRLQLALGLGAHRKVGGGGMPDWDMTFTGSTGTYRIGWKDMPVGGNLQDLIDGGFVVITGNLDGVGASINSAYAYFTGITADNTIRIKKTADITYLFLDGASINWTWDGALPAKLTYLHLYGHSINWTWDGAMPAGLTYLYLNGSSINWTGSEIGNIETKPNMTNVSLTNFISPTGTKMTAAQFSGIINSLAYNVGTLPSTVVIDELPNMTYGGVNEVDWGKMDEGAFKPSELAIALKTVVITKGAVINLTPAGLTMPDETDDGVGFPEGFGDWWRIEE